LLYYYAAIEYVGTLARVYLVRELIVWFLAIAGGVVAENLALSRVFHIATYLVSFEGLPQIWLCRFLEPLVTIPILTVWLRRHGEGWHELGLRKPTAWRPFATQVAFTAVGLVAVVFLGIAGFWKPFHFRITPPPDIQDKTTLAAALAFMLLGTGLNQELVFRGFLLNRLVKAFRGKWHPAIVTTAVVFGLLHFAVGIPGVIDAAVAGLLLGAIYLRAEKNLWVVAVGHSIANAILLVYAYWTR